MNLQSALALVSVITASLILVVGVILLTGAFLQGRVPENYRYTLGGMMTLYALYRISMGVIRFRKKGENDDNAHGLP